MAKKAIPINVSKQFGNKLVNLAAALRLQRAYLDEIKNLADDEVDVGTIDYTQFESLFGMNVSVAGQALDGKTVYDLIVGTQTEINTAPNLKKLMTWIVPA